MFGNPIRIDLAGFGVAGVTLRPPEKTEMAELVRQRNSLEVQMYTLGTFATTIEKQMKWYEKEEEDPTSVIWGIHPDGAEEIVGITSFHGIHASWRCCTSGIVIANRDWWGKGVATLSHYMRTWYAVNILNIVTIQSNARVPNLASQNALLRMGYTITGKQLRNVFRKGAYLDTYVLSWINPNKVDELYPDGVPEELSESLAKAKAALELADRAVKLL